jgi:hypothetical protein
MAAAAGGGRVNQRILDGYIAGDGSDRKGGGWLATSASRRLRDDVATLASSVGLVTSKGWSARTDERTGTESNAHSVWTPYMTKRKSKSGKEGVYQIPPRRRRMLDEERDMVDLECDGHLFLIGDGLVTHNSVRDRPTKAHEQIFLLSKSSSYFYDQDAERVGLAAEPHAPGNHDPGKIQGTKEHQGGNSQFRDSNERMWGNPAGRNLWSWWADLKPSPVPDAHFATFPESLPYRCLRLGTSERGACPHCGAPWKRVVVREKVKRERPNEFVKRNGAGGTGNVYNQTNQGVSVQTKGWEASCSCPEHEPRPCVILDPFLGSGTTLVVARRLGLDGIGIELNEQYAALAERRVRNAITPVPTAKQEGPTLFD